MTLEKRLELIDFHLRNYGKDLEREEKLYGKENLYVKWLEGTVYGLKLAKQCIEKE